MSKKQIKKIIFMGVGCALLLIVGTIYSLLYNDGRWVKNMDMSEYVFFLQGYSYVSNWSFNSTICYLYSNYLL